MMYRQTCINGHPATVSPDNGKPWRCGDPECEYFEDADDTAYATEAQHRKDCMVNEETTDGCTCGLYTRQTEEDLIEILNDVTDGQMGTTYVIEAARRIAARYRRK